MPMFDPRIFDRKVFDTPKVVTAVKGGYVPPIYKKYKIRKKDQSILDEINQLLEVVEDVSEIDEPQEQVLEQQIETVKQHFDFAAQAQKADDRKRQMLAVKAEIRQLRKSIKEYAQVQAAERENDRRRRLLLLA